MGTLASAIAQLENTNPAYNNPFAISGTGDTGTSFGTTTPIGIYSSPSAGLQAGYNQLSSIYDGTSKYYTPNMTLDQFGEAYAPKQGYGAALGSLLGVPTSTPIANIPSGIPGAAGTSTSSSAPKTGLSGLLNQAMNALDSFDGTPNKDNPQGQKSLLGISLHDVVIVVVGLILLAAGVFAFKNSQTVVETVTRGAKRAAELTA